MDRHILAAISIAGTSLDLLGGMYLAYDLLGGKHGPLRTLTRGVTYAAMYGVLYGVPLGWRFGVAAGLTHGFTLAIELSRAARQEPEYGLFLNTVFSLIRAAGFGVGLYYDFGVKFAFFFSSLSTIGQSFMYSRGMRPSTDYRPAARPRISRWQLLGVVIRTVGYAVAGVICGLLASGSYSKLFALKIGLVIGIATAIGSFITPYVEWEAETLPERRLGVFGICLILTGFSLQSVQYWTVLLDLPVK